MVEGGSLPEVCAIRINGTILSELSLTFSTIPGGNATCKIHYRINLLMYVIFELPIGSKPKWSLPELRVYSTNLK